MDGKWGGSKVRKGKTTQRGRKWVVKEADGTRSGLTFLPLLRKASEKGFNPWRPQ